MTQRTNMKSKFEMMSELGEIQENSKQLAKTNNFANITLGELLSHTDNIIRRNALSILKQLQKQKHIEK
jgi:hypothetical protein